MFWLGQKKFGKRFQQSEKNGIFDKSEKIGNPVWQLYIREGSNKPKTIQEGDLNGREGSYALHCFIIGDEEINN